jgi:PTS system nitrogen regulatory IIA component
MNLCRARLGAHKSPVAEDDGRQGTRMSHESITIEELATRIGRDRREVEKLANRGRIPGRKVGGVWQFHPTEIRHWLEHEMRGYSDSELAAIEEGQRVETSEEGSPILSRLSAENVQVPLQGRTKPSVLESLIEVAGRTWQIWEPATVLKAVLEREEIFSTGFENGVAIPHPRNPLPDVLGQSIVAFGRTLSGIPFGAPRRQLTDLYFLVLCRDSRTHLHILARLGRLIQSPGFLDALRAAETSRAAYDVIAQADKALGNE